MDLSLLIFTLETYMCQFCMKCIEFTTRKYNFKILYVGSLIWSAKIGVKSSYFPRKFSTYVPCSLLHINALGKPRRLGLLGASVNKNKYIFFSRPRRAFFKIVCGLYLYSMRKCCVTMKIAASEIGF
jgi:hypothetical protein